MANNLWKGMPPFLLLSLFTTQDRRKEIAPLELVPRDHNTTSPKTKGRSRPTTYENEQEHPHIL